MNFDKHFVIFLINSFDGKVSVLLIILILYFIGIEYFKNERPDYEIELTPVEEE